MSELFSFGFHTPRNFSHPQETERAKATSLSLALPSQNEMTISTSTFLKIVDRASVTRNVGLEGETAQPSRGACVVDSVALHLCSYKYNCNYPTGFQSNPTGIFVGASNIVGPRAVDRQSPLNARVYRESIAAENWQWV